MYKRAVSCICVMFVFMLGACGRSEPSEQSESYDLSNLSDLSGLSEPSGQLEQTDLSDQPDFSDRADPIALFPERSRWRRVQLKPPASADGEWQEFPSSLGASPQPWELSVSALVPRMGGGIPACTVFDGTRLSLTGIEAALASTPAGEPVCAVVQDEDQVRALAVLGERLLSLVVLHELEDPGALASFVALRALAVRMGAALPGGTLRLGQLERLELETPPGSRGGLSEVADALGLAPARLRELKMQGELDPESLGRLSHFAGLELLHLDWLPLSGPPNLAPLARLRRLRDLALRGGAGLFSAAWETVPRLPRLQVLSLVSLAGEPVQAGRAPAGLSALRLEGRLSGSDVEALSRLGELRFLHLSARGGTDVEPVDLEPLRRLRLTGLSLQGDFLLDRPMYGLLALRWIAMPQTRTVDLSAWTRLIQLDLTLTAAWAVKLPASGNLERLRLQDVGDAPAPVPGRALAAALSAEATEVTILSDGLDGLPPVWPTTLRTLRLACARLGDTLWPTLTQLKRLERLSLGRAAVSRPAVDAYLRATSAPLNLVELHDTAAARGKTLTRRKSSP